jgi:hypothetical protein
MANETPGHRDLPAWYLKDQQMFLRLGLSWGTAFAVLSVAGIIAPAVAAFYKDLPQLVGAAGMIASIATGLATAFQLGNKTATAWRAYNMMKFCGVKYQASSKMPEEGLVASLFDAHKVYGSLPIEMTPIGIQQAAQFNIQIPVTDQNQPDSSRQQGVG